MGKASTFIQGLLCVAIIGGIGYEGFNIYSNLTEISTSKVTIGNSNENTSGNSLITDTTSTTDENTSNIDETELSSNKINFRNVQVSNKSDLNFGNLVCVTIDNYQDYYTKNLDLCNIYENRISAYSVSGIDAEISSNVIKELNSMISDFYEATGNDTSMIRLSYLDPKDVQDYTKCDHITGLSFNLSSYDGNTIQDFNGGGDFSWILERADKYGFIQRFPSDKSKYTGVDEPSHFRYVGLPHSAYMKENNLCLEEYIAIVSQYTYNNPLEITTFNGRTYNVYYVTMDKNNEFTNIPVLMDKEYSISGDNFAGYIVTVKISG